VKIVLPASCVLNPSAEAAVVGGNVLTSQRVTDVILKAFSVCAASQGCMNNLTLGHATLGYYEVSTHILNSCDVVYWALLLISIVMHSPCR
jgi:N-methylhydantoinase B/oxoprolinase/acetone carboxylase alpha subunit